MLKILLLKLRLYIAEHKVAIILSATMTFLVLSPVWSFPFMAKDYKGINIAHFGSDAHFYLSRGREVFDGNKMGNVVLREGKDKQDPFFSYNEIILLTPLRWLGLSNKVSIVNVYHFYNAISIFTIILLIYHAVLQMSGDKKISIASAIFVVGGYQIVYNKSLFYTDFNIYGRTMIPYIASLAFFIYLNLLIKVIKAPSLKRVLITGAWLGFLFYVYFFAWTFAFALNGSLFLFYLISKNWKKLFLVTKISLIGLLIGLYNLIMMFKFFTSEAGKQSAYFHWSSHGSDGIFSKIGAITFLLLVVFVYFKRKNKNIPIIFGLIGATWLSLNQQILTGNYVQYGHYYWYFIVPTSIIIAFYMFWELVPNKKVRNIFIVGVIFVAFLNTVVGQYMSIPSALEGKKYEQNYKPIIDKLNEDKKRGVILTSDDYYAYLFTIFTPHDLFWQGVATQTDTSIDRFKDALYIYMYLNSDARVDFKGYIDTVMTDKTINNPYKWTYAHIEGYASGLDYYTYTAKMNRNDEDILRNRSSVLDPLVEGYNILASTENGPIDLIKKYGVNYIVWNKNLYPEWDLSFIKEKEELISYNNIFLYKIN
ncbi:MAG: hypothetical protein Q8P20_03945 [bacterium]|nr:hypothetical protein [bacterium]